MKPLSERKRPERYKGIKRGPRPPGWISPVRGMSLRRDRTVEERFTEKVDKDGPMFDGSPCWLWTGAKRPYGYGHMFIDGKNVQAHHVSLQLVGVTVPEDLCVDHRCRRPACVNPAHLRVVTYEQNALENNDSPFAQNAAKTHCKRGHPYSDENTAIKRTAGAKGTPLLMRVCLTCFPQNWRFAIVERKPPGRSKLHWVGPQTTD